MEGQVLNLDGAVIIWLLLLTMWMFAITIAVLVGYVTDWDERLGVRAKKDKK